MRADFYTASGYKVFHSDVRFPWPIRRAAGRVWVRQIPPWVRLEYRRVFERGIPGRFACWWVGCHLWDSVHHVRTRRCERCGTWDWDRWER